MQMINETTPRHAGEPEAQQFMQWARRGLILNFVEFFTTFAARSGLFSRGDESVYWTHLLLTSKFGHRSLKIKVSRDVTQSWLVNAYRRFGEACCLTSSAKIFVQCDTEASRHEAHTAEQRRTFLFNTLRTGAFKLFKCTFPGSKQFKSTFIMCFFKYL